MKEEATTKPMQPEERAESLAEQYAKEEGNSLEKEMGIFIADKILYRTKYSEEVVDSGYDVSTYPKNTNKRFRLKDYTTVGDFLKEPNGETMETYCSGSGMACQNYLYELEELIGDLKYAWFVAHTNGLNEDERLDLDEEFYDRLNDMGASDLDIEERFGKRRLEEVVNRYEADARQRETIHAKERELRRLEAEQLDRLNRRTHEGVLKFRFGGVMPKTFTKQNKGELKETLDHLAALEGRRRVAEYVKSGLLPMSRSLQREMSTIYSQDTEAKS